jgi:hypothetical protein
MSPMRAAWLRQEQLTSAIGLNPRSIERPVFGSRIRGDVRGSPSRGYLGDDSFGEGS